MNLENTFLRLRPMRNALIAQMRHNCVDSRQVIFINFFLDGIIQFIVRLEVFVGSLTIPHPLSFSRLG